MASDCKRKKLCLVCSSGGHLLELYIAKAFWENYERFWISFSKIDVQTLLKNETVYYAFYPTQRNLKNLFKNFIFAWRIIKREKPSVIISTGAGVGVPAIWIGKLFSIKTIWVESLTFVNTMSLSGRLVYWIADEFLVQWPELAVKYKKAEFKGPII